MSRARLTCPYGAVTGRSIIKTSTRHKTDRDQRKSDLSTESIKNNIKCAVNMNNRFNSQYLDKTGMWASALCAVHCMALPVLLSYSAFSGLALLEHSALENGLIVFSGVIGAASLAPSYVKHHKKLWPIVLFLIGFSLIGLSRFHFNISEPALMSVGATLVATAHFFNYRYCKKYHSV